MHKFETSNKNKLDNEWRRQNLPPFPTLESLGITYEDIVADVGCGIGYFTIPAAELIKATNKVYALDISEEMLGEVERRASLAGVLNVVALQTKEYDLKLHDEAVSFVLIANVLHEIEEKSRFLEEARRILKPSGKIAILEWEKKQTEFGPPMDHRLAKDDVVSILSSFGFELNAALEFVESFYGIVAVKK